MKNECPILKMKDIRKVFPGVVALDGVSFDLRRGEAHALVGENGAGKSTLAKVLTGVYSKDGGEIILNGERVEIKNPFQAKSLKISIIHQELNLVPHMSVAENIFIDFPGEFCRFGFVNRGRLFSKAEVILRSLGMDVDPKAEVGSLGIALKQMVEVAKALALDANIIIMDEPTSTLTDREILKLFETIRDLKRKGVAIVYISHRMEELKKICDRATVLRDGRNAGTIDLKSTDTRDLIRMMVGRELGERFPKAGITTGAEILRVEGLSRGNSFKDISFSLHRGEILGIAGLVGAGRTELARAIFGADRVDKGEIYWFGQRVRIRSTADAIRLGFGFLPDKKRTSVGSPLDAIRLGLGFLPEDRKSQGLVLKLSVQENISIALLVLGRLTRWGVIRRKKERELAQDYVNSLRIKTPHLAQCVRFLSGGNQQKVVLAKWMSTKPKMVIFDEPTRGIDVGAKVEVYQLMTELAREGVGIIMISSDLPEILGMADRILVLHEGRLTGEVSGSEATEEKIMELAIK
ncbi:MAG: sugar ABC transporter ATP-binding protein [Elusimicrobia bacterium]|nr:sugar ABC transporter ATP-binding protein [Elusimicrobiota bacterium]